MPTKQTHTSTVAAQTSPVAEATVFLETEHTFYYDTQPPVTARALARSLLGLAGVARCSLLIINHLLPQNGIESVEVLIKEVTIDSLNVRFFVRLIFGTGKRAEEKRDKFEKMVEPKSLTLERYVAVAIACTISHVAFVSSTQDATIQEADVAAPISIIADTLETDPSGVMGMLKNVFGDRYEPATNSVGKLLRPTGDIKAGEFVLTGRPPLVWTASLVKSISAPAAVRNSPTTVQRKRSPAKANNPTVAHQPNRPLRKLRLKG